MNWFKHAFGIDPPGPAKPTESQRALIEKLCAEIVRRKLTTPALLVLEMHRPFHYLSAQVLHFFQPFASVVMDAEEYKEFTSFLEQRGSIDYFVNRLEALEELGKNPVDGKKS